MRISDWSSDVCSSDLGRRRGVAAFRLAARGRQHGAGQRQRQKGFPAKPFFHEYAPVTVARPTASPLHRARIDRKSVVSGKGVSVRVDLGCRRMIKKKKEHIASNNSI